VDNVVAWCSSRVARVSPQAHFFLHTSSVMKRKALKNLKFIFKYKTWE
jgi:hypothetical protein